MSTPEQAQGDSLKRQFEGAREYASAHGLELVEDLRDIGVSACRGQNCTEGTLGEFLKAALAQPPLP